MKVKVKKLLPNARLPVYGTEGAACFDLHAQNASFVKAPYPHTFHTGLAFEVPEGHVMLVFGRSGLAYKEATRLSNCVGVIDSDYRGEVSVRLQRDTVGETEIKTGDRIAQAMIIPVDHVEFELVDELSDTARGAGGFGSTGK